MPVLKSVEGSDPRRGLASGRALGPSSTPLPSGSELAGAALQAVFEVGPGGRLPDSFRERPAGCDRPWPPSLKEVVAAFGKCRKRSMTEEQHRALLELLVAWDILSPECLDRSASSEGTGDIWQPVKRHFGGESDTSGAAKRRIRRARRRFRAVRRRIRRGFARTVSQASTPRPPG